jgi:hypothetical protein
VVSNNQALIVAAVSYQQCLISNTASTTEITKDPATIESTRLRRHGIPYSTPIDGQARATCLYSESRYANGTLIDMHQCCMSRSPELWILTLVRADVVLASLKRLKMGNITPSLDITRPVPFLQVLPLISVLDQFSEYRRYEYQYRFIANIFEYLTSTAILSATDTAKLLKYLKESTINEQPIKNKKSSTLPGTSATSPALQSTTSQRFKPPSLVGLVGRKISGDGLLSPRSSTHAPLLSGRSVSYTPTTNRPNPPVVSNTELLAAVKSLRNTDRRHTKRRQSIDLGVPSPRQSNFENDQSRRSIASIERTQDPFKIRKRRARYESDIVRVRDGARQRS